MKLRSLFLPLALALAPASMAAPAAAQTAPAIPESCDTIQTGDDFYDCNRDILDLMHVGASETPEYALERLRGNHDINRALFHAEFDRDCLTAKRNSDDLARARGRDLTPHEREQVSEYFEEAATCTAKTKQILRVSPGLDPLLERIDQAADQLREMHRRFEP